MPAITASQSNSISSPEDFWELLNVPFRENIIALHTFKEIDCQRYLKNEELVFDVEPEQAHQNGIRFAYNFYAGEGKDLADMFLELQRIILIQLLAMFRIQHSSKKSGRHKLMAFLEFIQDRGVMILERELVAAYEYFKNRDNLPLFSRVNMGGNQASLFEKIDNLAWDLTAARFLERLLLLQQGDFTVPLFASSDKALLKYLKLFPIRATVVYRPSQNVISIPSTITE